MPEFEIQVLTDPWVCGSTVDALVEHIWKRAPDILSDDEVFVLADSPGLRGRFVPYRYFWAKQQDPTLPYPLKILAVSGICLSNGRVLVGRRGESVTQYPGHWELVPSGGLEPRSAQAGRIDYRQQLVWELEEETGLSSSLIQKIETLALIEDGPDLVDLCCVLHLDSTSPLPQPSEEYVEFRYLTGGLSPDLKWVPTSKQLFELHFTPPKPHARPSA